MIMDLDSIFLDEKFDDLTREVVKKKVEKVAPEVRKFQEIIVFINENGREPQRTKEWSNERALWARLRGFRDKPDRAENMILWICFQKRMKNCLKEIHLILLMYQVKD